MMATERIRNAVMADAQAIAELLTQLGYPTDAEAMKHRLSLIIPDPRYATFVAEASGEVIGVGGVTIDRYYEKDGLYSRIAVLSVADGARGSGIGGRLVDAIERWSAGQ